MMWLFVRVLECSLPNKMFATVRLAAIRHSASAVAQPGIFFGRGQSLTSSEFNL